MITLAVVTVTGHANWRCCPAGTGKLGLGAPVATTADPPKFTKQKSLPALSTTTVSPPAGSATFWLVVVAAADTHPLGLNDWICPTIGYISYCCIIGGVTATSATVLGHVKGILDYASYSGAERMAQIMNISVRWRKVCDGPQRGAIPEKARPACVRAPLRYGGAMLDSCRDIALAGWLRMPACGRRGPSQVTIRFPSQCTACRRQTSPIVGTIFASTKRSPRTWFPAMYHVT